MNPNPNPNPNPILWIHADESYLSVYLMLSRPVFIIFLKFIFSGI